MNEHFVQLDLGVCSDCDKKRSMRVYFNTTEEAAALKGLSNFKLISIKCGHRCGMIYDTGHAKEVLKQDYVPDLNNAAIANRVLAERISQIKQGVPFVVFLEELNGILVKRGLMPDERK